MNVLKMTVIFQKSSCKWQQSSNSDIRVPEVDNDSDSGLPKRVLINDSSLLILTMTVMTVIVVFQKSLCK